MRWIVLREANLRDSTPAYADLREADLRRTDLRDMDFEGADMEGADLRSAKNPTHKQIESAVVVETSHLPEGLL